MIWNYIRDFFVQYIFGGNDSLCVYHGGFLGQVVTIDDFNYPYGTTYSLYVPIGDMVDGGSDLIVSYLSIGDWLSTTATIITLVIILVAIGLFIRWLFRLVSGLITFRG